MTNTMKSLLALCLFCGTAAVSTAETPVRHTSFKPGEIWTDNNGVHINAHGGGILYDKGTYYWYGEHKVEGDAGNRAQVGVHCYSSRDLYNWKDEGIALKVVEGDNSHPIVKGCILERPKVVYNKKTKKYVMWFHLELKGKGYGAAYAGVATATKPTGPFTFLGKLRRQSGQMAHEHGQEDQTMKTFKGVPGLTSSALPEGVRSEDMFKKDFEKGQMSRDMTIFVDDDGKAYHIYSSEENSTTHIAELTPDYTEHTGAICPRLPRPLHGSSRHLQAQGQILLHRLWMHRPCWANARSAVAPRIAGPWTELKNPCVGPKAGSTFGGQSTYILPVQGKPGKFIFMADIWRPQNAIDGRYMWLPIQFDGDQIKLEWKDEWKLEDM